MRGSPDHGKRRETEREKGRVKEICRGMQMKNYFPKPLTAKRRGAVHNYFYKQEGGLKI